MKNIEHLKINMLLRIFRLQELEALFETHLILVQNLHPTADF